MKTFVVRDDRSASSPPAQISVLLACYNQAPALRLTLEHLTDQSFQNFEVICCDDGSTDDTQSLLKKFRTQLRLVHVWQKNEGFRKTWILNQGARLARGEYLVLLDSDCVPHPDFLKAHWQLKEPGRYLAGRRVDLGPRLSAKYLSQELTMKVGSSTFYEHVIKSWIAGDTQKAHRSWPVTSDWLRRVFGYHKVADMMGCNGSFFKTDFFQINGFDESFVGYFREDGDLEERFKNAGLVVKSAKSMALQFHLWHPRRTDVNHNDARLLQTIQTKRARAIRGVQDTDNMIVQLAEW